MQVDAFNGLDAAVGDFQVTGIGQEASENLMISYPTPALPEKARREPEFVQLDSSHRPPLKICGDHGGIWRSSGSPRHLLPRHASQAHHQLHVVLDQQHGDAVGADGCNNFRRRGGFGGVHAGRRLVERQQLCGSVARARAISRRRWSPYDRLRGQVVGARGDADVIAAVPARGARSPPPRPRGAGRAASRRTRRRGCARGGRS